MESKPEEATQNYVEELVNSSSDVAWHDSLQFALSIKALLIFVIGIASLLFVITFVVKSLLIESEKRVLLKTGVSVVGDIGQIIKSTESHTKALASLGAILPKDKSLFRKTVPQIINQPGNEDIIAGGGIWPEEFLFDPQISRHSFFWARDENNQLEFLDNYNKAEGSGYHKEEWYVPVKYVPKERCYWSKSYFDPYSFEPMVTCTIPIKDKNMDFTGAATLDIKLSGLTKLIEKTTQSIDGYAFVVDRNNKFLSYPDLAKAKYTEVNELGEKSVDFLHAEAFTEVFPDFSPIAKQLAIINKEVIEGAENTGADLALLAEKLAYDSYQIEKEDALLLAAILLSNDDSQDHQVLHQNSFKTESDVLLKEPVLVQIFLMPETFWKLVLVTPESAITQKIESSINYILFYLVTIIIFIFGFGYWLIGKAVVRPFKKLVYQLSSDSEKPLDESASNEFGLVARKINTKTQQLRDSYKSMAIAMDKRDRADKLRRVSEKRFKAIARTAPDAIISVDEQGKIVDWNPAATEIFGYGRKVITGRKYHRLLVPGEIEKKLADVEGYLNGELESIDNELIQVQAIREDGYIFTAEFSATSWSTERGRFFSLFLRDITDRIQAEYKLRHQALHDPLTELPNRNLFKDRLMNAMEQAKRSHILVAVMIIDLDNFKIINDTLGHGIGDKLLQVIAERVVENKRATDTIARLGGDEFGVIQTNLSEPAEAMMFASRIRESIAKTVTIDDNTFQVGCSIGVTIYPNDSVHADNLLRNADMAMYQAKEEGRNSVRFFVEEMDKDIQQRKEILEDISVAIADDQFEIHLQPLIDLKNDQTVGAEALIRWHHPEKGFISPAEFIPIAEQSKAINDIGQWVVKEVCRLINEMDEKGLPEITIALNISPAQFKRENIYESITSTLKTVGVSPHRIECEITESATMENVERVIQIMHSLRNEGFKLSIDDFGTGYSSLSFLKRFPINKIKIDRSFIADIETDEDSASIAKSIIQLGHSMNLVVLAEGVETQAQQDWLIGENCDMLQGYFRARPMPFNDFVEWVQNN